MFKLSRSRAVTSVAAVALIAASGLLAGCGSQDKAQTAAKTDKKVTVLVNDSFYFKKAAEEFKKATGYELNIVKKGATGELLNQLVLTKSNPLGDVVYGLDTAFSSRAVTEGLLADAEVKNAPAGLDALSPAPKQLIPVDQGDVCVNVDLKYFADKNIPAPAKLEDLTKPEYKNMFVTENPASSSPGLNFMLATIAHFGKDGWLGYWKQLKDNGLKIDKSWTEAFNESYTAGESHKGTYPIVTSYSTSPSASIDKATGKPTTASLGDTCFRQVEFAGVLKGAKNVEGANAFINWMLTKDVQETLAKKMWVYPVNPEANGVIDELKFDQLQTNPLTVKPEEIAENLKSWLTDFTNQILG